jgi:hypothetical protein
MRPPGRAGTQAGAGVIRACGHAFRQWIAQPGGRRACSRIRVNMPASAYVDAAQRPLFGTTEPSVCGPVVSNHGVAQVGNGTDGRRMDRMRLDVVGIR